MSLFNVHANWFPVDGKVKFVEHRDGNFYKVWLPKASEENEHADIMLTTPDGVDIREHQRAYTLTDVNRKTASAHNLVFHHEPNGPASRWALTDRKASCRERV